MSKLITAIIKLDAELDVGRLVVLIVILIFLIGVGCGQVREQSLPKYPQYPQKKIGYIDGYVAYEVEIEGNSFCLWNNHLYPKPR